MRAAYDALRSGSHGTDLRDDLLDRDHLHGGREEFWLPFEAPFTRFDEILANSSAGQVADLYLGGDSRVTVDHVNVINAPGGAASGRQPLHRDSAERFGQHLEVHVLLRPGGAAPLDMGPPRFCPCVQEHYGLRDPTSQAVMEYFVERERCHHFQDMHWVHHAGSAGGSRLWATIYDSQVYHQGLENVVAEDRPVLVIALAASDEAVHSRRYLEMVRDRPQPQLDAIAAFRAAELAPALAHSAGGLE